MKLAHLLLALVLAITTIAPFGPASRPARAEQLAPAGVDAAYLVEELVKHGTVSLIVGLDMPGYDPALFDQVHAAGVQEASIANAQQALLDRLASYEVSNIKTYEYIPFVALTVDSQEALAAIYADPAVTSIEEDELYAPLLAESVPLIQADQMHNLFYTGAGKTIAILDTGVDKYHPALAGKVVSEACYSSDDLLGPLSPTCPGGSTSSVAPNSGLPCPKSVTSCDHGTHVAHIAAAVAPGANIIAIQVFSSYKDRFLIASACKDAGQTSPCARTSTSDYLRGLNRVYALRNTYDIVSVNMSLGSGKYTSTCDGAESSTKTAVDLLRSAGIATVVATGNNGYLNAIGKPACLSNVISVGSVNSATYIAPADLINLFTNISPVTTLLAPGTIKAAIPASFATNPADPYGFKGGTSMAAPHVAGAIAVLQQARPDKNVNNIVNILSNTGPLISDWRQGGVVHNKRRLDVYGSVCRVVLCDNDDFRRLFLDQTLSGRISSFYDRDHYYIYGTAGQRISVRMNALSTTLDPHLELYDPQGNLVTMNDNGGGGLNALINGYLLKETGRYLLLARTKVTTASGDYTLSMSARVEAVNPEPYIKTLTPSFVTSTRSGQDFWMLIRGLNFVPTSEAYWNGQRRTSLYYDDSLLYLRVLGSDLADFTGPVGTRVEITVRNPTPGGGISNGALFWLMPAFLGESELVQPESGSTINTGIQQRFVISWTHPTDSWRTMQYMDLRFRTPAGQTLASIRVVEQEGPNSAYQLLNSAGNPLMEEDGETPVEGLGGEERDLELPGVLTLHLAESAFSGSGRTAIMTPTITFGPEAVGVYNIEFRVDGPDGEVQDDDVLGQITITPQECPYPVTGVSLSGPESGMTGADYTYTATLEPLNASQPLTITWAPEPVSGQGTNTAVYNWSAAGEQLVFVSAENCGGFGADVKAVRIRTSETPDLTIGKSGPAVAVAGEAITYTLTISNSGAETATNLVVLDELPAGATHVSGGVRVGNTVRWDLPALAGYGAVTETVVAVVANSTLTNTAYSVSAQGGYSASGQQPLVTRLVAAKTSSDPLSDATLYTTDSSGRRLIDLTIPAGSVFEGTTFTLDELDQPGYLLPDGLSYAGRAFRLGAYQQNRPASDLELGEAISLTVAYDAVDAASAHTGTLGLYAWNGSEWTQAGLTCTVQSEQQQLACRYSGQRLTQFALATSSNSQPVAGVALNASTSSATAAVGTAVEYRLTVTNTGNTEDSFVVTVDSGWSATLSTGSVGPLAPGASSEFSVTVTVPAEAADGESNVATVSAVSQADGSVGAQLSLTTTAQLSPAEQPNRLFLPAILSGGS